LEAKRETFGNLPNKEATPHLVNWVSIETLSDVLDIVFEDTDVNGVLGGVLDGVLDTEFLDGEVELELTEMSNIS